MKKYQKPEVDVFLEEVIDDVILSSTSITANESVLGFEGDETW